MRSHISQAIVSLLIVLMSSWARTLQAESLPSTPAETLSGQRLEFPGALAGKPAICVFGFSREAGDRSKAWMKALSEDGLNAWSIADLEAAPALVRGMIRSSMRKGTPDGLQDRSLILTRDLKSWKEAVGAKNDRLPELVLFDAAGRILWTYEGVFSEDVHREARDRIAAAGARSQTH